MAAFLVQCLPALRNICPPPCHSTVWAIHALVPVF